jgi:hypothetical protein
MRSNERVSEVSADFEVGLWHGEVMKREDGENVLVFSYGSSEPEIFQGDEVTNFLAFASEVQQYINEPLVKSKKEKKHAG